VAPPPAASPARAAALRRRLLAWWDAGHRELPWRFPQGAADPYRVWLAEVMLQQTRVEAVIPRYRAFLSRWPTLEALAAAPEADLLAAWSGLGYYARCRNLAAAARQALRLHGGLPASIEALLDLPGFGPYTAGAVASIAFAIPAAAVDGNAARVLARLFGLRGDPGERRYRDRLWELARRLAGEGRRPALARPGDLNQALMDLGATVCGRTPSCGRCPLTPLCRARSLGLTGRLPVPQPGAKRRRLVLACAVIERRGRVLLARRSGGLFAGMLGFPSADARGRGARAALCSELAGMGVRARAGRRLASVDRVLTHRVLRLVAYACSVDGRPPRGKRLSWTAWGELERVGLPTAMRALAAAVCEGRSPSLRG